MCQVPGSLVSDHMRSYLPAASQCCYRGGRTADAVRISRLPALDPGDRAEELKEIFALEGGLCTVDVPHLWAAWLRRGALMQAR